MGLPIDLNRSYRFSDRSAENIYRKRLTLFSPIFDIKVIARARPLATEASNNPHFPETPFVTDCTTRSPIPSSVFRLYPFSCDAELDHSSVTYYSRLNHTLKRLPLQDRDSNCDGRPFCPELGAPPTFECHLPSTFPSRPTSPE
ncbi:hypothetical protein TNIN_215631 [Trichonephila inaurata madagascariensis]|uniref:Uncharacterized protein n=1 Tax=Trichonephila inaurata madagascariensis TaxID=2747483 RepID=A0A8X6X3C3_9ARAC|nr:hypothetical protein TNIN_215631 [Trichonephila inaurata madagascariensis]